MWMMDLMAEHLKEEEFMIKLVIILSDKLSQRSDDIINCIF